MNSSAEQLQAHDLSPILAAVVEVADALSLRSGRRQFYTLAQVQSQATSCGIDRPVVPWVFAALVTRSDFEAYYAVREVPGTYQQLRERLSARRTNLSPDESSDDDVRERLWSALDWLELAADLGDPS
jgi:hypothetical protein